MPYFAAILAIWSLQAMDTRAAGVLAYYQDDGGVSSAALRTEYGSFNEMASDTYDVDTLGVVTGPTVASDLSFARQHGMKTFATVSNYGRTDFSPAIGHAVIRSATSRERFIAGMLKILAAGKYTGINIDFEAIPHTDRAWFTEFIAAATRQMHGQVTRLWYPCLPNSRMPRPIPGPALLTSRRWARLSIFCN